MDKELTFHPEKERTRDLIYSEYSSCDRSIHLLFQESPAVPYEFLLRAYRTTVEAYLSCEELRPPLDFLEDLLSRFDGLSSESGVLLENWRTAGIHLLLRSVDAVYVLTSCESQVLLCSERRIAPVAESDGVDVERLQLNRGRIQQELFASNLSDLLSVLRLDRTRIGGKDLVLGCAEREREAVVDALSSPVWAGPGRAADDRAVRQSLVSHLVSRRVLAVRFDSPAIQAERIAGAPHVRLRRVSFNRIRRRRWVMAVGGLALAVLVGILWKSEFGGPRRERPARVSRTVSPAPTGRVTERRGARSAERESPENRGQVRLAEAWRNTYAGEVTSSPVLFEGCVVFGCRDASMYAVERGTGAALWKFSAASGIGASPAVRGGRVFVADYSGKVYAVDGRTGREIWSRRVTTRIESSPRVVGERVVVGCFDGYAYCLSADDGATLWKKQTRGRIRGSPALAGEMILMPSYDGYLYALSVASGAVMWRSNLGGPVSASPAVEQGLVVVGGADGRVHGLDAVNGSKRWSYATGDAVKSSIAIAEGRVFAGSNDGCLYCLNLTDGSRMWKFQTGGIVLARPLVQDGVVYAGSYDGRLYALEASNGRLLGAFETGGEVYSSPAGDDDNVYFGTNRGEFICLSSRGDKPR